MTRAIASVGIALTIALAGCSGVDFGDRPAHEFPREQRADHTAAAQGQHAAIIPGLRALQR